MEHTKYLYYVRTSALRCFLVPCNDLFDYKRKVNLVLKQNEKVLFFSNHFRMFNHVKFN